MSSITSKDIILLIISFLLGCCSSYYFYTCTKIDGLELQVENLRSEVKSKEDEISDLDKEDIENKYKIQEARNDIERKEEKIRILEDNLVEKRDEILALEADIEEKEEEIRKSMEDMKEIMKGGKVDAINEKYEALYEDLLQLRVDKETLKVKNSALNEEKVNLKLEINELKGELKDLETVDIPELEETLEITEAKLEEAKKFKEFINVRADIRNIRIDNKKDVLFFDLIFNTEEINYLKNESNITTFTFTPVIVNESNNRQFIPRNFSKFSFTRNQLSESMTITFPVQNYSFDDYKNGRKGVNMEKDHLIDIKVTLEELHKMEIANKSFYLK